MQQPPDTRHVLWDIKVQLFVEIMDNAVPGIRPGYYINKDGLIYNSVTHRYKSGYVESDGRYCGTEFIKRDGSRVHIEMQKLIMRVFKYFPEMDNYEVNHIHGKGEEKHNNSLSNLEWCTHKENMDAAKETGLILCGEDTPMSILTENQVREICSILEKERYIGQFDELAAKYGVSKVTILEIAYGYTWRNVSCEYNIDYNNKLHNRFSEEDVYTICSIFQNNQVNDKNYQYCYSIILSELDLERNDANRQRIRKLYNRDPGYFKRITDQYKW